MTLAKLQMSVYITVGTLTHTRVTCNTNTYERDKHTESRVRCFLYKEICYTRGIMADVKLVKVPYTTTPPTPKKKRKRERKPT